ncbi:MAG: ferrous iron transport protein A [Verrucomicrobia bacterium]|nr:MAG: ferrous iron transport protein A [Verrucomicrobiota bacterium]
MCIPTPFQNSSFIIHNAKLILPTSLLCCCISISISYLAGVSSPANIAQLLQQDSLISLEQAKVGCEFHIRFLQGPACEQLRQMGFCESMRVKKITDGRNLLCTVCGTKLALSRELAHQILVEPSD